MSRSINGWVAKHDDEGIPPRVQLRVFQNFGGNCAKCTRKLEPGKWACDHVVALINGGPHAESNLQPLCVSPCHSAKTREDVAIKSVVYRKAASHAGIRLRKSRPLPGSRNSRFKKRIDGTVVIREKQT
jgi:5-methylcytosine-specific restriction endonuclease McrA